MRRGSWIGVALGALAAVLVAPPALGEGRVYKSPEHVEPLQPGAEVPHVSVRAVDGTAIDLASLVADRGALLVFYRGGW